MINYDYFAVIAKFILDGDPTVQYDNATIRKVDCDDTWRMILDHCSSIKADVLVSDRGLIVNVKDCGERYLISYHLADVSKAKKINMSNAKKINMEDFKRKFSRNDPILVMTILDFYENNKDAILYEEQHGSRIHYGVKVGDDRVYEGAMKL